ncbi:MAG: MASE1 domain-containing protein [Sphingomonadales bacterium]|nr:MASE1 domain-containing protein [Sphingomonadales bacterium]
MEQMKSGWVAKGIAFSVIYCAAYLVAWYHSLDQWFLPTGLRVAGLLLLPYRYWPFLFLGDAAGLLEIRVPKADRYGALWAYLSPFLLAPLISIAPAILRTRLKRFYGDVAWLPLVIIAISFWSSLCKIAVNYALSGPTVPDLPETLGKYVVGDCFGILLVYPPILIWRGNHSDGFDRRKFIIDTSVLAGTMIVILLTTLPLKSNTPLKQLLLVAPMLPVALITLVHGWRGAAIGITSANLLIGVSLREIYSPAAYDQHSFFTQINIAVFCISLLELGAMISKLYERARRLGIAESHAHALAQSSFLSSEQSLKDKLKYMAQMQMGFDEYRRKLIVHLRESGHYAAAMELNAEGVEQMAWFERQSAALYPLQLERQGLYAALHSHAFSELWAGDAEVMLLVKGQPKSLSLDLQLSAYRCICNSFALLSECAPDLLKVRARVWRYRGHRGIAVSIIGRATKHQESSSSSTLAALELEGRVKAHNGAVSRRSACRINLFMSEVDIELAPITGRVEINRASL